MSERILIWGAGAVGASVGAALFDAGHDVEFVDTDTDHVLAFRDPARGLTVEGPVFTRTGAVKAWSPADLSGRWDQVFLCVKAHHTAAAASMLAPHLSEGGYVLTLQNGLAARIAAEALGRDRILVGFVNFGSDRMDNGRIALGNRGAVALGEWHGESTPRLECAQRLMCDFEPDAVQVPNIWDYIWGKLAYAALLFAQAVGESGIAAMLDRSELLPLWHGLVGEVLATARAEGVNPAGFNGFDPAAFAPDAQAALGAASVAAVADFYRVSAKQHSGVWRDLAVHRRKTEVDAQLGMVVKIAATHGLTTPVLESLIVMIHRIELGEVVQNDDNLRRLVDDLAA